MLEQIRRTIGEYNFSGQYQEATRKLVIRLQRKFPLRQEWRAAVRGSAF
jgi:hypothetical protein